MERCLLITSATPIAGRIDVVCVPGALPTVVSYSKSDGYAGEGTGEKEGQSRRQGSERVQRRGRGVSVDREEEEEEQSWSNDSRGGGD